MCISWSMLLSKRINTVEVMNPRHIVTIASIVDAAPNAGVQRRRTAPNEGRPLASPSPAHNILTDFSCPVLNDSKLVASGMTERGAGAVRCNDLFDDGESALRDGKLHLRQDINAKLECVFR